LLVRNSIPPKGFGSAVIPGHLSIASAAKFMTKKVITSVRF
jgi:hypothetical protein